MTYPTLARQAKRDGAQILFWDESGFRADTVHGKTWGLRGQTPIVYRPGHIASAYLGGIRPQGGRTGAAVRWPRRSATAWLEAYAGSNENFVLVTRRLEL